ncbi:restriction endonuclease subunit S [Aeromonas sp. R7-4]|uniref:restriction endonuclease subunit S n=1 Tax=Aeromonas sp. R7-4 TaxID=3138476 RepID=UPI0034A4342C
MAEQMMQETAVKAIPAGYKQTEVGVIPEDWQLSDIRAISSIPMQNGLFFEPKRKGVGVPLINVADMYASAPINVERLGLFNATLNEINVFRALPGDLFFTRSSVVPSGIAYCNVYVSNYESVVFDSHLIRVRAKQDIIYPKFLYLNCISKHARASLIAEAKTATMTTIDQGAINRCPVIIPPKKEQIAIVTVLSDSDALIDALEQLIAKKQAIKSATMQQLLTGRTRLPAFALRPDGTPKGYKPSELGDIPEDWEVVSLGDICGLYQPVTISGSQLKESGYPVYGANGLIGFYEKYNHEASQVIVTCRGSTCGTVNYTVAKSWITGNAMVVDVDKNKNLDKNFTYYMLSHQDLTVCVTGSGQPQIVRSPLAAFKVVLPEIEEQTAIATILSDMDNEQQALTQKLDKARALKQGMMQQLLTGKIRLPLAAGA